MQTIKISDVDTLQAPPAGQPDMPGQLPGPDKVPPKAAANVLKGAVSEGDALKAVEGTKITTLLPFSPESGNMAGYGMAGGNSVPVGGMLDSKLAVELMDALLPSLLVMLMAAIGAKMKKTDLQLTEKEKGTIAPVLQKCLDQLMINFNSPWSALAVTLSVIYGAKLAEKGFVQMLDAKAANATINELEKSGPVSQQEIKQANAAPVVTMKQAAVEIKDPNKPVPINPLTVAWEPDNNLIQATVKRHKESRKDAIARLKIMYAKGQHQQIEKLKK